MALENEQLIISVDDFKNLTAIADSFSVEVLTALTIRATDLNCQEVLGTALMDKLIVDYNAESLIDKYIELYDSPKASVKKMVIWQAYVYGLPRFAFKIQNNGISKSGGDLNANSIDTTELGILQREAKAALATYENRVKKYLSQNFSSFPELSDSTPEYLQPNLTKSKTDYGISSTPNRVYNDF